MNTALKSASVSVLGELGKKTTKLECSHSSTHWMVGFNIILNMAIIGMILTL